MSSTKIVLARQARCINSYRNFQSKILKCSANIYFNRQRQKYNLTPTYAKIRILLSSPAAAYTQQKDSKTIILLNLNNTTGCPLFKL